MVRYLRSFRSIRSLAQLGLLAGLWLVWSEGITGSWLIGAPLVVVIAILVGNRDDQEDADWTLSLTGLASYLPFFLRESIVSGFDVGLRVLRGDMKLQPALMQYSMSLPAGVPQRLFIHSITLMPGTLSVMVEDDTLLVHVLDERQPVAAALQHLEDRVGAVFGITLENGRRA